MGQLGVGVLGWRREEDCCWVNLVYYDVFFSLISWFEYGSITSLNLDKIAITPQLL